MKVGDLVEIYGWVGVVIRRMEPLMASSPSLLVHWLHNGNQVWRYEHELEVVNESR